MTTSLAFQAARSPGLSNVDAIEARLALRITSVLNDGPRNLQHDVTERLRVARETALERARAVAGANPVPLVQASGSTTLVLGGRSHGRPEWWLRLASVLPLVALVGGLLLIQDMHTSSQISAAAEVDSQLLADELPPTAYADPGFVEYLKTPNN